MTLLLEMRAFQNFLTFLDKPVKEGDEDSMSSSESESGVDKADDGQTAEGEEGTNNDEQPQKEKIDGHRDRVDIAKRNSYKRFPTFDDTDAETSSKEVKCL